MGGYLVRFPHARIVTLIWILFFVTTIEVPAVLMLAYWFFIQFASGAAETGMGDSGGVAWWAHVGGFVAGAILVWSRPRRRRYQRKYYY
jgi:membrane associated rhomboid family serine protease